MPTDFSGSSYGTIEKGVELAKHFEAELVVMHVAPTLDDTTRLTPLQHLAGVDILQLTAAD